MKLLLVKCTKDVPGLEIKRGQIFSAYISKNDIMTVMLPTKKRVHLSWDKFIEYFALTHG